MRIQHRALDSVSIVDSLTAFTPDGQTDGEQTHSEVMPEIRLNRTLKAEVISTLDNLAPRPRDTN